MLANRKTRDDSRLRVEFPSRSACRRFLEQVLLWNQLDDLPSIEVFPHADGRAVSFWCCDPVHVGPYSLIDSCRGRICAE